MCLLKKAFDMSVLLNCDIAIIIFNSSNQLYQFASKDVNEVLMKYIQCEKAYQSLTNNDVIKVFDN